MRVCTLAVAVAVVVVVLAVGCGGKGKQAAESTTSGSVASASMSGADPSGSAQAAAKPVPIPSPVPVPAPCPPTPVPVPVATPAQLANCDDGDTYDQMAIAHATDKPLICKVCNQSPSAQNELNVVKESSAGDTKACDGKVGVHHFGRLSDDGQRSALLIELQPGQVLCRIPARQFGPVRARCYPK